MPFYEDAKETHPTFKERRGKQSELWEARKDSPWHVGQEFPEDGRWVIVRYIGVDGFPHIGYSRPKTIYPNDDYKSPKETWTKEWEKRKVTHWMDCPPLPCTRGALYCSCLTDRDGNGEMLRTRITIPQYNYDHWHEKTQVMCHNCGKVFEIFNGIVTPNDLY